MFWKFHFSIRKCCWEKFPNAFRKLCWLRQQSSFCSLYTGSCFELWLLDVPFLPISLNTRKNTLPLPCFVSFFGFLWHISFISKPQVNFIFMKFLVLPDKEHVLGSRKKLATLTAPGKTLLNMAQMPNLLWKYMEEKTHIDFLYFTNTSSNRWLAIHWKGNKGCFMLGFFLMAQTYSSRQDNLFSGPGGKYLTVTDQDEWLPCASPSQQNTVTRHPGFVTLQLKAH